MKAPEARVRPGMLFVLAFAAGCGREGPPSAPPPPVASPPAAAASRAVGGSVAEADAAMPPPPTPQGPAQLTGKAIALPGTAGHATLDYLVFEPAHDRVWVPVADTGSVDVIDAASHEVTRIDGFKAIEREGRDRKRMMGPSSGSYGEGFVYVGDRGSSEICPVDVGTLKPAACVKLASPPDGVQYVESAKELWVTTPRDSSVTVLDATKAGALKPKVVIRTPGSPEGYAVDEGRGLYFTNLEDKDQTVVIDVKTHKVQSTWPSACGGDGPRGIAVDPAHQIVMVACTDHLQTLDAAHGGAQLAKLDTGAGVDNVQWNPSARLLYVGAGKAAKLSVIHVDEKGLPSVVASATTPAGARNPVVDSGGTAYLADPMNGAVFVVPFKPSQAAAAP